MKLKKTTNIINNLTTISVAGAGNGVGTTHLCITLAEKIKSNGFKVAVLEDNVSGDFISMSKMLGCEIKENSFLYKGIYFFCFSRPRAIDYIKRMGFQYLIIDNGNYRDCDKEFYAMSNINIIVASSRPWHVEKLEPCLIDLTDTETIRNYSYVIPFCYNDEAQKKEIRELLQDITTNIYFTEYNENPFDNYELSEINKILNTDVFKNEGNKKASFGLFRRSNGNKEEQQTNIDNDYTIEENSAIVENFIEDDGLTVDEMKELMKEAHEEARMAQTQSSQTYTQNHYRQPEQVVNTSPIQQVSTQPKTAEWISTPNSKQEALDLFSNVKDYFNKSKNSDIIDNTTKTMIKAQIDASITAMIRSGVPYERELDKIKVNNFFTEEAALIKIMKHEKSMLGER